MGKLQTGKELARLLGLMVQNQLATGYEWCALGNTDADTVHHLNQQPG